MTRKAQIVAVMVGSSLALSGLVGGVRAAENDGANTLGGVVESIRGCWRAPRGLAGLERAEQTVRFSLRRDGSVIGEPRVTFVDMPRDSRLRELFARSAVEAVRRCAPVRITTGLGGAIAGRPIAIRLIYQGPKGQGA